MLSDFTIDLQSLTALTDSKPMCCQNEEPAPVYEKLSIDVTSYQGLGKRDLASLEVDMPSGPDVYLSACTYQHSEPPACPVASQIQAFLLGLGIQLPAVQEVTGLRRSEERYEAELTDLRERLEDLQRRHARALALAHAQTTYFWALEKEYANLASTPELKRHKKAIDEAAG